MEITEVRITLKNDEKLKAFASITFDDCFVLRGLKIISRPQGYFISMPSRRTAMGTFQDIAHPITIEMRTKVEHAVLEAYEAECARSGCEYSSATQVEAEIT